MLGHFVFRGVLREVFLECGGSNAYGGDKLPGIEEHIFNARACVALQILVPDLAGRDVYAVGNHGAHLFLKQGLAHL
ncbi:hypothetical protein D3C83_85730 [compost metagenome]